MVAHTGSPSTLGGEAGGQSSSPALATQQLSQILSHKGLHVEALGFSPGIPKSLGCHAVRSAEERVRSVQVFLHCSTALSAHGSRPLRANPLRAEW